jgi:RNA methyltransferase, TrmH family
VSRPRSRRWSKRHGPRSKLRRFPPSTKAHVRRLRELLRDRRARDDEGVFVCEGPRVVAAALDHGVALTECFVGVDAGAEVVAVAERAAGAGIPVHVLDAKAGATVTPQPIFGLAPMHRRGLEALAGVDLAVVGVEIGDPGNAGALVRSAAAAGAGAVVLGTGSVDAYNPKVVRASAGACFAIRIVEGVPAMEILDALGAGGVQRLGALVRGGAAPETFDLTRPTAFVLGHETRGLGDEMPLDGTVSIPMRAGESLNVAMAGTVLCFEAARQRDTK